MNEMHPAHQTERKPNEPIVGFRLRIDTMINSTRHLKGSREVSLAHTNLQRAFAWLGKALSASGSTSPYKDSFNPDSKTIEPTAEHTEDNLLSRWEAYPDQLARVKDFRAVVSEVKSDLNKFIRVPNGQETGYWYLEYLKQSFLALEEVTNSFGWELARIKKEQEQGSKL